jgi:hypothetical protein
LRNGSPVNGATQSNITVDVNSLGAYSLKITNTAGCEKVSNSIAISDSANTKLFIYPNPSPGKFQVRLHSAADNLTGRTLLVYDAKGVVVTNQRITNFGPYTRMEVDLSGKGSGIFWVVLLDDKGKKLVTGKVMVAR